MGIDSVAGPTEILVIADAGNAVVEFSKTNNTMAALQTVAIRRIPPADLAVTVVTAPFTVVQGVPELLKRLHDHYPLAVVSARDAESTHAFLVGAVSK